MAFYTLINVPLRWNADSSVGVSKMIFKTLMKTTFALMLLSMTIILIYGYDLKFFDHINWNGSIIAETNCNDLCNIANSSGCNHLTISNDQLLIWSYVNWALFAFSCIIAFCEYYCFPTLVNDWFHKEEWWHAAKQKSCIDICYLLYNSQN